MKLRPINKGPFAREWGKMALKEKKGKEKKSEVSQDDVKDVNTFKKKTFLLHKLIYFLIISCFFYVVSLN